VTSASALIRAAAALVEAAQGQLLRKRILAQFELT
jgi:hypothetical protein